MGCLFAPFRWLARAGRRRAVMATLSEYRERLQAIPGVEVKEEKGHLSVSMSADKDPKVRKAQIRVIETGLRLIRRDANNAITAIYGKHWYAPHASARRQAKVVAERQPLLAPHVAVRDAIDQCLGHLAVSKARLK